MKKYIFLILLASSLFAQKQSNWSDKTINYPTSKDDSLSIVYADSGETIKALYINQILRAIRVLQDKVGIGSSTPSYPGSALMVQEDGSTAYDTLADFDSTYYQAQWRGDISDSNATQPPEWRSDISDSIASIGAQALNYQEWTVVAKSGGKYSTIQGAINYFGTMKADSQAIVEIMPGEYNEAVTPKKYVNLFFHDGARLNYKTAGSTYTITCDVTDTLWIMGGELRRETTTGTLTGVIDNAGKLFVTSDITDKGYNYIIVKNAGYFEYHGKKIASDRYYPIFWSTGGTVYVDANYCAFTYSLRGNTIAKMKWNKIVCSDSSYSPCDIRNTADVQIYSGETKQYYTTAGYNQEIPFFQQTSVEDSSRLYWSGNWTSVLAAYDSSYIHVDKAWCDEGMPRLDIGGAVTGAVIRMTNSNIKWIVPTPIARTTYGAHISEAGVSGRSKSYFSNSYIQWSKYHETAIDTAKEYGNIFYYSYGEIYVDNCTLIDYGNDYGYGNMMPFNSRVKTRFTNSHLELWGSESSNADMFPFYSTTTHWDFEMTNCSIARKGATGLTYTFDFLNTTFAPGSLDKLIFNNVSIYNNYSASTPIRSVANGVAASFFPSIWDSLAVLNYSKTFIPKLVVNNLRVPGPGTFQTNTTYNSDAKVLVSGHASLDTLQENGTNGDSALVTINYIENIWSNDGGASNNRRDWVDADLGLCIKAVNPNTGTFTAYYDIRLLSNSETAAVRYKFSADSVYTHSITIPSIVMGTASYAYSTFWIVNNHAADITIDIWIRESLGVNNIVITRQ